MGVHHAPGQLHQLAHMSHQQDALDLFGSAGIQGVPDEVGALHHRDPPAVHPLDTEKIQAVVPRR